MEHSKNFEKIKKYYNLGMWDDHRVRNAVVKHQITEHEYTEITGNPY